VTADFPLKNPCLQTCANTDITAEILQKCVDRCAKNAGSCCGNRLDGDEWTSSNYLSCANGCEIAYYRSTVSQCKADCYVGNKANCMYKHPNIAKTFGKCYHCSCGEETKSYECNRGCDEAANLPEYYQYVEPEEAVCDQDDVPRFLFAGQSNMEGWSGEALEGSFRSIIRIINRNAPKQKITRKLISHLNQIEGSSEQTSINESRMLLFIRKYLKKNKMFSDHPTSTCSYTIPGAKKLDCERPVSATACGGHYEGYGPELMFGHVFPRKDSCLKGKPISIAKVAVGGTELYKNWMKENKDENLNYWDALVDVIRGGKGSVEGFVWFQGENDSFHAWNRENYLDHLTQFIADVRQEIYDNTPFKYGTFKMRFNSPADVPVVICELGHWIAQKDTTVIEAQRAFVENDPKALLVPTGAGPEESKKMSKFYHYDAASQLIIGNRVAKAMAFLLNQ